MRLINSSDGIVLKNIFDKLKVVDLFCCFVDAHFTHIALSGKAQELIADALQLIETQVY